MLTVSDGVHAGEREDASGDTLEELLREDGFDVVRRVVPDDEETIARAITNLAEDALLVLTTGGTGFAPRDVTPKRLDRDRPGGARHRRVDPLGRAHADPPRAALARPGQRLRGATLVVNLPGSPGGCRDGFAVLRPALRHGLELAAGDRATPHRQT